MALVPRPLGRETFTYYYARCQTPRWQQKRPTFQRITISGFANGKGESSEDRTRVPDLTVYTPDTVWVEMVHGQVDRTRALEQGLYRVEGDITILAHMRGGSRRRPCDAAERRAALRRRCGISVPAPRRVGSIIR